MRQPPTPPKPAYVHQTHPRIMYHSNPAVKRTQNALDAAHEEVLISQGYQREAPDPPIVTPEMTKEEAIAQLQTQFDAAWSNKMREIAGLTEQLNNLQSGYFDLKADRDTLAKRLAKLTERKATEA